MANKINVKLILELRDAKMGRNAIASTRHISRNSVSDVFHLADKMGITYQDVRFLDDQQVYRMFYPDKHAVENMYQDPELRRIYGEKQSYDLIILQKRGHCYFCKKWCNS